MPASQNPADFGAQDYLIVALKAHQAWETAEAMKPLLGPETSVVTAQNGVPWWYFYGLEGPYADRRLASVDPGNRQWNAIGPERVIGCTVYPATETIAPGVIQHTYGNQFGLGEPNRGSSARVQKLADAFSAADLRPRIYDDIRDDIWIKLWGNLCFNPISALTQATLELSRPIQQRGHCPRHDAGSAGDRRKARRAFPCRWNAGSTVPPRSAHKTSMLQDF